VIQLHQGGIEHAIASLGTAFCPEQGQRLLRLGLRRLWIAYDGDSAGIAATARLIDAWRAQAVRAEPDLRVVSLPAGSDPDALVREQGPDALRRCLEESRHWLAWELDRLLADLQAHPDDLSLLQTCEREGAALLSQLPRGGALRQRAEQRLRQVLGVVPPAPVRSADQAPKREDEIGQRGLSSRLEHAERRALRLFLCSPPCRDAIAQLRLRNPLHREALGFLWHLHQRIKEAGGPARDGRQPAGDGLLAEALRLAPRLEPPLAALITSLAAGGSVVCSALLADPGAELGVVLDVLEGKQRLHN